MNVLKFVILDEMLVLRARNHKMLVKIANREDPYQTASSDSEAV